MSKSPSKWQEQITGEWHGLPSIFDSQGNHAGFNHVYRSSEFQGDRTTYFMHCNLDTNGPLAYRLEADSFAFGVVDSDQDRIYCGPDFIGAGRPFGLMVDANYYSPGWTSDLRTQVHILPDGETQVYSSLLFDGPAINSVFNGIYKVAHDYQDNPETRARIDAWIESERRNGKKPFLLPAKHSGHWSGEMAVYDNQQQMIGTNQVRIDYTPLTLLRARVDVKIEGVINRKYSYERTRNGNVHTFDGPDVFGNARAFGRYLWATQHFYGEAMKIRGRDVIIDDQHTISAIWQWYQSDKELYSSFGVLNWHPGEELLTAQYAG